MSREAERSLDAYLVAAAQAGDRKALDRLSRLWQPRLEAHAMRLLGDRTTAQDAAQDSWIAILRGLSSVRDRRSFGAWAYRIVTRRSARTIAQLQRDRAFTQRVIREAQTHAETGAPMPTEADERGRLKQAMATLPPKQYAAIALHYFEEMSVAEIAIALDTPEGTVKTRLMHGRKQLSELMEGESDE